MLTLSYITAQVKTFLGDTRIRIIIGLVIALAVAGYIINIKNNKLAALKTQISLAQTIDQTEEIQNEILSEMVKVKGDAAKIEEYQKLLEAVDKKQKELQNSKNLNDKEIEDFWKTYGT